MRINTSSTMNFTILLAIIFAIFSGGLIYWNSEIWSFATYVKEQRQNLRNETASVQFLSNIENEIIQTKEFSDYFDGKFIDKEKFVDFIEKIEEIAKEADVTLQIQNVLPTEGGIDKNTLFEYNYVNITMTASGSWDNANKFMLLIENMPNYVSVNVLNLSSAVIEEEKVWTAAMTITGITN